MDEIIRFVMLAQSARFTVSEVVIYRSYELGGSGHEIMFDWWGNPGQQAGISPDGFRRRFSFPDPDEHVSEFPFWTDCCGNPSGNIAPPVPSSIENMRKR